MAEHELTEKKNDDKRQMKKQRVMRFFMDALLDVTKEEGAENVTIKNVAERACYNSASLYNYFKNLDQLVHFSYLSLVENYLREMDKVLSTDVDTLTTYISLWRTYCLHSFANPVVFARVFMSDDSGEIIASFNEYCECFPDSFKNTSEAFKRALSAETISEHDQILIQPCIEQGLLSAQDSKQVIVFGKLLHAGIIQIAMRKGEYEAEANTSLFMSYFLEYLENKLLVKRDLLAEFAASEQQ